MKYLHRFNEKTTFADRLRTMMTNDDPIKLTTIQKMKLLKTGLKPDYREFGHLLMIVGIDQKRGSSIATIRKNGDKIILSYGGKREEFENISDCIDTLVKSRENGKLFGNFMNKFGIA